MRACGARDKAGPVEDLEGGVLHPAGPGQDLLVLVLELVAAPHLPGVVEDHEAGPRRDLVERSDEVGHGGLLSIRWVPNATHLRPAGEGVSGARLFGVAGQRGGEARR